MIKLINFTACDDKTIKKIRLWRNNPQIRKYSFNKKDISIEEHLNFIESLKNCDDKKFFIVQDKDEIIGVINFINITEISAVAGYYKNPELDRKGVADILFNEIKKYAESSLNLKEVIMFVFKDNKISIHCIEKNGYKYVSEKDNVIKYRLDLYENRQF